MAWHSYYEEWKTADGKKKGWLGKSERSVKTGECSFVASVSEGACSPLGLLNSRCGDAQRQTGGAFRAGPLSDSCSQMTIERDGNIKEECIFNNSSCSERRCI